MAYLTKSIEKFGSGFKRIDSLCRDAGVKYSYDRTKNGFKFILYRSGFISDTSSVTYDVTYGKREALNITEQAVLAELKQRVSKTVRTVQRALGSLTEKGYIKRVGAKKNSTWEVLKEKH